jgi:hypothetical protein
LKSFGKVVRSLRTPPGLGGAAPAASPTEVDAVLLFVEVVDAIAIEASASSMMAEYSFDQLRLWAGSIVSGFHGLIRSWRREAIECQFTRPSDALAAAHRLLSDVNHFNATKNRAALPMVLRCAVVHGRCSSGGTCKGPAAERARALNGRGEPGTLSIDGGLGVVAATCLSGLKPYPWEPESALTWKPL